MKKRISLLLVAFLLAFLLAPACFAETAADLPKTDDASVEAIENETEDTDSKTEAEADPSQDEESAPTEDAETTDSTSLKTIFAPANFVKNLVYMGKGMLGIFVVIGVIVLATAALNKIFQNKKDN